MRSEWWKSAVIYQIYPKSFQDSNGDGIGDLQGIRQRLPYLQNLGVDALWLSPVYQSPQIDNGYDISDYYQIDPMFGTSEDMNALIADTHARGMKIIMDFVANHTSDQYSWFQESRKSLDNPYSDFYIWRDPRPDGSAPNNWGSSFGGSAWTYEPARQQYYLHYYAKEQPDLNWENPRVRDAIYEVMKYWKSRGVDGWRLDVITSISKNWCFPDNPRPLTKENQHNGPRMHEFIHDLNQHVLTPYDMMSVGEAPASNAADAPLLVDPTREELDMVFTFQHMHIDRKPGDVNGRWALQKPDFIELKRIMADWQTQLRGRGWNALYFENHDRARVISRWGNDSKYRYECATAFATILHGMQGTPYVYQGEEIGMTNPQFALADYEDVEMIGNYHQFVEQQRTISSADFLAAVHKVGRDNARTPMQWDGSHNAGFSDATPWFKLNPNYTVLNVARDANAEKSVAHYYQQLIRLRHDESILRNGSFELLLPQDKALFAYKRHDDEKTWLVLANLSEKWQNLQGLLADADYRVILSNYQREIIGQQVAPYESFIVELS
ncbi:alpha-glucosidase [Lacticaseibacillus paracasei]|uniref:glycoside hydrolase family 13 protein n=1 Tax=Lacticaseibacillus paracasei TaxID=1597 RepID=UPI000297FB8A|nr:alpha-glucosidase [Lacticaseibacillus paracasei]EKP96557.1 trehalose-6-phosphate hydrolase [Lacticaseibacillus paracasei]WBS98888.1 alpha-glucosidase [Lacticaseibacillus paracasei]